VPPYLPDLDCKPIAQVVSIHFFGDKTKFDYLQSSAIFVRHSRAGGNPGAGIKLDPRLRGDDITIVFLRFFCFFQPIIFVLCEVG